MISWTLLLSLAAQPLAPVPVTVAVADTTPVVSIAPTDTIRRRPRAVEYSDAYNTRLTIHRVASYTMLPLFAAEYALGQNLLNDAQPASWMRPTHVGVALGLGALFTVNTVTGVWNLYDARNDPTDRTRRIAHTVLMLAADAGFAWSGASGGGARRDGAQHKNIAIGSMAISAVGAGIMWFWKN
jgi:hypothetical protein